jgi:NAD(P)H-dependent FMN reductase
MNTHIISASHRAPSQSAKVAHFLATRIEAAGGHASVTELAHNALPLWDEGMWSGDPKWKPIWSPIEARLRAADSLIVVVPEYAGMAAAAAKNLFLFCGGDLVAHKPTLLVAVSSGQGGSYPIAEMRASSYKNSRHVYLPEHVIVREAEKVLNGDTISGPNDEYMRKRIDYALRVLAQYEAALRPVRESGILTDRDFPFGM